MKPTGEIRKFRVTSHRMRYGLVQPERWFDRFEEAEAEVKRRLGLERFHRLARWTRFEFGDRAVYEHEHDGFSWTCSSRCDYSQAPRSTRRQEAYGFVRVEEMRRRSPPFVNPFAAKREPAGG